MVFHLYNRFFSVVMWHCLVATDYFFKVEDSQRASLFSHPDPILSFYRAVDNREVMWLPKRYQKRHHRQKRGNIYCFLTTSGGIGYRDERPWLVCILKPRHTSALVGSLLWWTGCSLEDDMADLYDFCAICRLRANSLRICSILSSSSCSLDFPLPICKASPSRLENHFNKWWTLCM